MSRLSNEQASHQAGRSGSDRSLTTLVGAWLSGRAATGTDRGLGRATGARC
jgi:hypothetical protein